MDALQLVKLVNGDYSCEVLANYGAALNSYQYKGVEFVAGYSNPEEIVQQQYKGVILAPFPNRIAKGKYSFKGKEFQLPINRKKEGLALHGFAYNKAFEISRQTKEELVITYSYNKDLDSFPFKFTLVVSYSLSQDGVLAIKTIVSNDGGNEMPFGLGWHPYFQIGDNIDKLSLDFPASRKVLLDDKLIPNGKEEMFLIEKKRISLKEHQFDDCFVLDSKNDQTFVLSNDKQQLKIKAEIDGNFPFFQIYTPKDRHAVAIEPMSCAPDSFNNGRGLILIPPQKQRVFEYAIHAS